jgi:hypothetical protein
LAIKQTFVFYNRATNIIFNLEDPFTITGLQLGGKGINIQVLLFGKD